MTHGNVLAWTSLFSSSRYHIFHHPFQYAGTSPKPGQLLLLRGGEAVELLCVVHQHVVPPGYSFPIIANYHVLAPTRRFKLPASMILIISGNWFHDGVHCRGSFVIQHNNINHRMTSGVENGRDNVRGAVDGGAGSVLLCLAANINILCSHV